MATIAYIALGSNQGDRRAHMAAAVAVLGSISGISSVSQSPMYETDPVGGPAGQGKFLNSVAVVNTDLLAGEFLKELHQIEAGRGRDRMHETERCGPRPLDLDILLFGDQIISPLGDTPGLTVPHPRMHQRWFVIKPLCDIAPDVVHPVLKRTASELLAELEVQAT
jgi:2-amino-4-hydroxy-6-hydroxymethyldihydropteridine diphosphokinase